MAWLRVALCVALCAMPLAGHADPLIIAEFMAANDTTVLDADGDSPDWIEVVNTSLTVVDAEGWYLTDEANLLTKWRFPPVQLAPGASVVIFASGKDRTEPDIHTNFRLSGSGEYHHVVMSVERGNASQPPYTSYGSQGSYAPGVPDMLYASSDMVAPDDGPLFGKFAAGGAGGISAFPACTGVGDGGRGSCPGLAHGI